MTITIVIINTRQEMRLECEWRHTRKRRAENLEDFEKDLVEVRPWCWEVDVRSWCWEVEVWPWSWGFEIGPCRQTIEFLPLNGVLCLEFSTVAASVKFLGSRPAKMNRDLKRHEMCRTLRVVLAYYDYERPLRIVSLHVSKNRNQKLINAFVPEQ